MVSENQNHIGFMHMVSIDTHKKDTVSNEILHKRKIFSFKDIFIAA
jgi:hypothetical protein